MLLSFFEKKEKKGQRDDLPAAERQINARSGIDLLACMLSPPSRSEKRSFYSTKGIYVRKARVVIQQMTDRRGVFISLHGTSPLWGCGTPSLRWGGGGGDFTPQLSRVVARHPSVGGTSLLEGIFPLNEPIRACLFLLAPRPKSRRHHVNKGWAWFEASACARKQQVGTIGRVGKMCAIFGGCAWCWALDLSAGSAAGGNEWTTLLRVGAWPCEPGTTT